MDTQHRLETTACGVLTTTAPVTVACMIEDEYLQFPGGKINQHKILVLPVRIKIIWFNALKP
jgi:hypothetical protein